MKHSPAFAGSSALSHAAFEVKEEKPTDIPSMITAIQKTVEEFKSLNDQRFAEIAKKGAADVLTEEQVDRINGDITRLSKELDAMQKAANRPQFGSNTDSDKAVKSFNMALKSHAVRLNRALPADVTGEDYAAYKSTFRLAMQKDKSDLSDDERKALSVGSDPDGGFLVPPELEQAIDRVVGDMSAMRGLAQVRSIGTASYKKPVVTSGASSGWAGEKTTPSETSTPQIAELEFTPGTAYAEPRATTDLLEDASIDLEAWLADEVAMELAELEGAAFISGDGINKPRGLLSYTTVADSSYSWGSIGYKVTGAAAAFATSNPSDQLVDLQHALKRKYRPEASFLMNDATLGVIRKFKDGNGIYLWQPNLQLGALGVLLGAPVVTDDFMPDLGANEFPVAFGNFRRGYLIAERRGITVLRDPYTAKPYVKFYTTKRVGGGVQNFEAIKLLKCST